jgi:hypothetical protein
MGASAGKRSVGLVSGFAEGKALFRRNGLVFPEIPTPLRARLRRRSSWCYATRPVRNSPYNFPDWTGEALLTHPRPFALVAHAGHGMDSYALHYFLVWPPLQLFIQVAWGNAHGSPTDASDFETSIHLANRLVTAVERSQDRLQLEPDERITVSCSTLTGIEWVVVGVAGRRGLDVRFDRDKREQGTVGSPRDTSPSPKGVLQLMLNWCEGHGSLPRLERTLRSRRGPRVPRD